MLEHGLKPTKTPFFLKLQSPSSAIKILQSHIGGGEGKTEMTSSEEKPTRLVHTVTKPIIQEVREIIAPIRKVTQGL